MPYTKNTWVDEVLAAAERYNILEDGGGAFKSNMQINLATSVSVAGSSVNASRMNNIEEAIYSMIGVEKNILPNGGFQVAQRGAGPFTSASGFVNNDDSYLLDGCILLSDGNDIVDVSQVADTDFVSGYKIRLDVETANKRFGVLFPVANKDIQTIRKSGKASIQFKIKRTGTSVANVRAYLLAWNSTADAITSDVISAWGTAGNNPTFATNWTAENTGSNISISTTIATKMIENIAVDTASVANLALLIMIDDTDATVGDFIDIGDVQLEEGAICTPFISRPYAKTLDFCKRFLTAITSSSNSAFPVGTGFAVTTTIAFITQYYKAMRTEPSIIATASDWLLSDGVTSTALTAISIQSGQNGQEVCTIRCTVASGLTAFRPMLLISSAVNKYLLLSAEL